MDNKTYYIVAKFTSGNEIVDEFDNFSEAKNMQAEYTVAFGGTVISVTSKPSKSFLEGWNN